MTKAVSPEEIIAKKLQDLQQLVRETIASNPSDHAREGTLSLVNVLLQQPLDIVNTLLAQHQSG